MVDGAPATVEVVVEVLGNAGWLDSTPFLGLEHAVTTPAASAPSTVRRPHGEARRPSPASVTGGVSEAVSAWSTPDSDSVMVMKSRLEKDRVYELVGKPERAGCCTPSEQIPTSIKSQGGCPGIRLAEDFPTFWRWPGGVDVRGNHVVVGSSS